LQHPVALVFDEYDAARPEVMFILQRLLEAQGKFTLADKNRVIKPNPYFRMFATANTIGLGDATGLYHGVQPINQGQMDRWNIVATLNYLPQEEEVAIVSAKVASLQKDQELAKQMVTMADLTREGFQAGDLSTVMSPRTVISWAENADIFGDRDMAFRLSFLNKCDEDERSIIAEYYQRVFGVELLPTAAEVA
jgi:cobaltochelatase CobS